MNNQTKSNAVTMKISDILTRKRTVITNEPKSQKKILEFISEICDKDIPGETQESLFKTLVQREKFGSTAIGNGVAIPHGRLKNLDSPMGCFIITNDPIAFEANDQKEVDIFFTLFVPEDATNLHLELLGLLAKAFKDKAFVEKIRHKDLSQEKLHKFIVEQCDDEK